MRCPIDKGTKKRKREQRGERREEREEWRVGLMCHVDVTSTLNGSFNIV